MVVVVRARFIEGEREQRKNIDRQDGEDG